MTTIRDAVDEQIRRIAVAQQCAYALDVVVNRIVTSAQYKDQALHDAISRIRGRIHEMLSEGWNNLAMLGPVDEVAMNRLRERTRTAVLDEGYGIMRLASGTGIWHVADEEQLRLDVAKMLGVDVSVPQGTFILEDVKVITGRMGIALARLRAYISSDSVTVDDRWAVYRQSRIIITDDLVYNPLAYYMKQAGRKMSYFGYSYGDYIDFVALIERIEALLPSERVRFDLPSMKVSVMRTLARGFRYSKQSDDNG